MSRARALERRGRKLPCGWVSPRVNGIRIETAPTVRLARREAARRGGKGDQRAEWRELQGTWGRGGIVPRTLVFFSGGLSRAVLLDFSWLRAWGVEWAGEGWALKKFPMKKSILVCSELLLRGGSSCIRTIKRNAAINLEKMFLKMVWCSERQQAQGRRLSYLSYTEEQGGAGWLGGVIGEKLTYRRANS